MSEVRRIGRRLRRDQRGQAALEFAIIAMALILVSIGIVEFGRALQVRNELSFAADFAARQILTNPNISDATVENKIRSVFKGYDSSQLSVVLGTETADGLNFRTVALSYPFTLLIPGLADPGVTLKVSRRTPKF